MIYIPKPYKPRLFPRLVRWSLIGLACVVFIYSCILGMWILDAFLHHS